MVKSLNGCGVLRLWPCVFSALLRECEEHDCILSRSTSTAKKNRARLNYSTDLRAKQTLLWHGPFRFVHRWEKKYISAGNFVMFERWTGWLLCYTWDFALRLSLHRHLISTCTPEELKSYPIWKNRDIVGVFWGFFYGLFLSLDFCSISDLRHEMF